MQSDSVFSVMIDRRCRVRSGTSDDEAPLQLDDDGFLDPSAAEAASAEHLTAGALVTQQVAATARALVLLGEPGAGKSTVFARLAYDGETEDEGHPRVVEVDAADLVDREAFNALLGIHLDALPPLPAGGTSGSASAGGGSGHSDSELILIVDQLDESPILASLPAFLRGSLRRRDTARLRFMIGCRTADYPVGLTRVLATACDGCTLADLAPLTRDEAVALADSVEGVDGEALVDAAVAAGAGGLASVPLTLAVLARTYRRTGSLEDDPARLFAQGVEELLDEPDVDRTRATERTPLMELSAVAGRVAAWLLLSGRRTISRRRVTNSSHDMHLEDVLLGGAESTSDTTVGVTLRAVEDLVSTALFTGRGTDRVAFVHSSLAAFLCARYLSEEGVPVEQLERLLLVAGGDRTRSVPVTLRETAAWLVALNPMTAGWLVEADPESLAHHTAIIVSPEARRLIVAALLDRAPEVELGGMRWARHLQRLAHPGLDVQLLPAFEAARQDPPTGWAEWARLRLVVRLAAEAATPQLAEPLVNLACSDDWDVVMRQEAARAALRLAPNVAGSRLAQLASRFADAAYAAEVDPHDDLRGLLLSMLWPDHLSLADVLPLLRHRHRRQYLGLYYRFQRTFPAKLPEADVPTVLEWAKRQQDHTGSPPPTAHVADDEYTAPLIPEEEPIGALDAELLEAIIDRATTGPGAAGRLGDVAELLLPRIQRGDYPPIPAAVDLEDQNGEEPPSCQILRRQLAYQLIARMADEGTITQQALADPIFAWSDRGGFRYPRVSPLLEGGTLRSANRDQLLDQSDFPWLYQKVTEAVDSGNAHLSTALAQLAAALFSTSDPESRDLASSDHSHPVWPLVAPWLQPPTSTEAPARPARRRRPPPTPSPDIPSPEETRQQLNQLLDRAVAGDTDCFWQLAWNLQVDPSTGSGVIRLDDNLLDFPGVRALDGDASDRLTSAALRYITTGNDHADSWLGTDKINKRAWAGCLALTLLERKDLLSHVPAAAWRSWVGALVWFPVSDGDPDERQRKARLLSHGACHAADVLCQSIRTYVGGELRRGERATEVKFLNPGLHPMLVETWEDLLGELAEAIVHELDTTNPAAGALAGADSTHPPAVIRLGSADDAQQHALELWRAMLVALHGAQPERAAVTARRQLDCTPSTDDRRRRLAAQSAWALLLSDANSYWPEIHNIATNDPRLGREIALACASDDDSTPTGFADHQLAEVYRWLSSLFPPETDDIKAGFRFSNPDAHARTWRDATLRQLGERGTIEAETALASLREDHPDRLLILSNLIRARTTAHASAWSPPHPKELSQLLQDSRRRLVRSDSELLDLLVATLQEIEQDLEGHAELLWDRIRKNLLGNPTELWLPKPEAALSAYLTHELKARLVRRGIAVNREVLVRPTDAYGAGDRTDILVEARTRSGQQTDRVAVVVEVKGAWNPDLLTAQRQQLAEKYLPAAPATGGIYVIGWNPPELWTCDKDWRRAKVKALDRADLLAELEHQADAIGQVRILPVMLQVPRPTKNDSPRS